MQKAVAQLKNPQDRRFDCGAAGTVLRFLLARLSREQGEFELYGDPRLFARPHQGLLQTLEPLGCLVRATSASSIHMLARGWDLQKPIFVEMHESSQFASSLLLSAWNLPQEFVVRLSAQRSSYSYLQMTIELLKQAGMDIHVNDSTLTIPAQQTLRTAKLAVEADMSSVFAVAAIAAAAGTMELANFFGTSLQPDFYFLKLLKEMGIPVSWDDSTNCLTVRQAEQIKPLSINLNNNPDLFPVLAVLLSRAAGTSQIAGIETLIHKESNRLANTLKLLRTLGFECSYDEGIFTLNGRVEHSYPKRFAFDPDQDHRMAMAAALAYYQGAEIEILNKHVVSKSFPEFWEITKLC